MLNWEKLEGVVIIDRYEIKNKIGAGGAGVVYLAKDLYENRLVAIKAANPLQTMSNYKKRFQLESKILSKLNHPNIIKYYDDFEVQGIRMIVIEYVEGISLEDKLRKEKTIDKEEAIKYTKQLLSALSEVHSHKVYHRDIKTSNIHITIDGDIKLLDFGIVQESIDQDLTQQGSVIGTISYLAPEIITSVNKKSDERTDIYSVGIMLYQLLTGIKPFKIDDDRGMSLSERNNKLALKIVRSPVLEPHDVEPKISKELSHFIMKLIEREPGDRYQTCQEAIKDLEQIENGAPIKKLDGYYKEETEGYSLKKQVITLSVVIVLLLLIVIIVIIVLLI